MRSDGIHVISIPAPSVVGAAAAQELIERQNSAKGASASWASSLSLLSRFPQDGHKPALSKSTSLNIVPRFS